MSATVLTLPEGFSPRDSWGRPSFDTPADRAIRSGDPQQIFSAAEDLISQAEVLGKASEITKLEGNLRRLMTAASSLPDSAYAPLEFVQRRFHLLLGQVHLAAVERDVHLLLRQWLGDDEIQEFSALNIVLGAVNTGEGSHAFAEKAASQVAATLENARIACARFQAAEIFLPARATAPHEIDTHYVAEQFRRLNLDTSTVAIGLALQHVQAWQNVVRLLEVLPPSSAEKGVNVQVAVECLKCALNISDQSEILDGLSRLQQLCERVRFSELGLAPVLTSIRLDDWITKHAARLAETALLDGHPELVGPAIKIAFESLGQRIEKPTPTFGGSPPQAIFLSGLYSTMASAKLHLARPDKQPAAGLAMLREALDDVDQGLLALRNVHERILENAARRLDIKINSLPSAPDMGCAVAPWWVEGADLRQRVNQSDCHGIPIGDVLHSLMQDPFLRQLYRQISQLAEQAVSICKSIRAQDRRARTKEGFGDSIERYTALQEDALEAIRL